MSATSTTSTLDVFDRKSGKLIKQVPLSNRPNNIAVAKDGRIVVGIARGEGALDIIDPATLTLKKTIPVHGRLHNVYVTPDSKYVITGSIREERCSPSSISPPSRSPGRLKMSGGVRPMAIEANPDGSTKRIFAQLSDLNGFAVVDFARAQGDRPHRTAEADDATSKPTPAAIRRRRTASASRRTTRPCGSPAFPTTPCSSIRSTT